MNNFEIKEIEKNYGNNRLFDKISFKFPKTGFVGIFGESGSGKTTLLNILGGLEEPSAGTINNAKKFAYVFQDNNLFYDLSIDENLFVYNSNEEKINELLSLVNLYDKKSTPVRYLSGGEIQRISIIRAFLSGADIILLDEPTSALDSKNEKIIYELLKQFSNKKLML